jgi:hypothetical protein
MLATRCVECGAPVPASLATPNQIQCRYCGYQGEPSAEAVTHMNAAAAMIATRAAELRQLSGRQQRALGVSSPIVLTLSLLGAALYFTPVTWVLAYFARHLVSSGTAGLMVTLSASLMAVPLLLGVVRVWWNHRSLRKACTAAPPEAPGEPSRCHVCGAPLTPEAGKVVARCAFCQADNFIAPALVEAQRRNLVVVVDQFEAEVDRRSSAASRGVGRILMFLGVSTLVAPMLGVAAVKGLELYAVYRPAEYVLIPQYGATCIARVHHTELGRRSYNFSPSEPLFNDDAIPWVGSRKTVFRDALVGRKVIVGGGMEGTITGFKSRPELDNDWDAIISAPGGKRRQPLCELCLVEGSPPERLADLGTTDKDKISLAVGGRYVLVGMSARIAIIPKAGGKPAWFICPAGDVSSLVADESSAFVQAGGRLSRLLDVHKAYLSAGGNGAILDLVTVADGVQQGWPGRRLDMDNTHVYWSQSHYGGDPGVSGIVRVAKAGGSLETLVERKGILHFGLGTSHVAWVQDDTLFVLAKDGRGVPRALTSGRAMRNAGHDLMVHNGRVYWSDKAGVHSIPVQGGEVSTLAGTVELENSSKKDGILLGYKVAETEGTTIPGILAYRIGDTSPRYAVPGVGWAYPYDHDGRDVYWIATETTPRPRFWSLRLEGTMHVSLHKRRLPW